MNRDEAVATLLSEALRRAQARARRPEATYRLQLYAHFTFRQARSIVPYLHELGVTHLYASPYLKARPGSTHGYDIVDHSTLNPEIGTRADYDALVAALHEHGMGQVLDTVPNHMAVGTNENAWWNDVLENGPASRFGGYFDIAWQASLRPEMRDKVLLPVLGEPSGDVLESGQLKLAFDGGAFFMHYFDRRFPLAPRSYAHVLAQRIEELEAALGPESPPLLEYQSIVTAARNLPDRTDTEPARVAERSREKEVIKRRLAALVSDSQPVRAFVEENVAIFNGKPGDARSFDLLDELLEHQCYRLAYWRVAPDEINYRRFFDVNDLAALSMERLDVFEAAHALILQLLAGGQVDGLRVDHPDGLYDPEQYFRRLQEHYLLALARVAFDAEPERFGGDWKDLEPALREHAGALLPAPGSAAEQWPLYVVAEKILGATEALPDTWALHGTSGYDFLNVVNGLFVDADHANAFTRLYRELTQENATFPEMAYQKKRLVLVAALASELHMLAHQLDRLAQKSRKSRDFTFNTLRAALREVIACFPVYRSYIGDEGVHDADRRYVEIAVRRAAVRNPLMNRRVFRFIRDMLLLQWPALSTEADQTEQRRFPGKFQQVTAPVTAKGIEDTAFYVYNRLIALNEVGGEPDRFGVSCAAAHRYNAERAGRWPYALSPLSTHDTKRSEDVRARLNVLSEIPEEWAEAVERWSRLNAPHRHHIEDATVPDANEEYLLYQTLVGAWPLEPDEPKEYATFVNRIQAFREKALHEAKVHSSWINPNAEYDQAVRDFLARLLDPQHSRAFLNDFRQFQRRVAHFGLLQSLAQTLLRIGSPGVPDTYQGTELWDFSLVDPDNRRPVDYDRRRHMLEALRRGIAAAGERRAGFAQELVSTKEDGRVKLYVTYLALHCRRDRPGLFSAGDYVPLPVAGSRAEHVFAFARRQAGEEAVVAVPRLLTRLVSTPDGVPLGRHAWHETRIVLDGVSEVGAWRNVFTGETLAVHEIDGMPTLTAADVFAHFPVALLVAV